MGKGTYMQRRYRTKKYYCGEYLEVAIYPVYTHPKKRGKRSKPTTEIQQRLNQRHTEGRLRRLLHTNFTPSDLFATLTFDDANLPASWRRSATSRSRWSWWDFAPISALFQTRCCSKRTFHRSRSRWIPRAAQA